MKKQRVKGQVAIEFMIMMSVSLLIGILLLIALSTLSRDKIDEKTYYELDDFGSAIQREFLLAAELEDGYVRTLTVPHTVNGRKFNISIGSVSNYSAYLLIKYSDFDLYYVIPPTNGTIGLGEHVLRKENNTLYID